MSDRTICGACRSEWPCDCSEQAVPVVLMESADDDLSSQLAQRMRDSNEPLTLQPFDPDPPIRSDEGYGKGYCGHRQGRYDVDEDRRVVSCRKCRAVLDPYFVLSKLSGELRRKDQRLAAAQELERREAVREGQRRARAAVRRHRYAPFAYQRSREYCGTCGGERADAIHKGARS